MFVLIFFKMNFNKFLQDIKPHLFVIIIFFLVGYVYFIKTFNGYTNREEDVTQGIIKSTEIVKYKEKEGQVPGWTNSIFSGMPSTCWRSACCCMHDFDPGVASGL